MDKTQARNSIKKINSELFSLTPSTLVTLFEIDVTDILFESGVLDQKVTEDSTNVFRFHNNIKLYRNSIIWQGKEFFPAPIHAEGFELSTKGTLPVPKLSITVNEESVELISLFREKIALIGDLAGAKVTRIRTFSKFLDVANFSNRQTPRGFSPDPNAEFPRDIYYIDRKSTESRTHTEYELSSVFDLEGIKIPARVVYSDRCSHTYRGEGCCYEYANVRNAETHGDAILPVKAPARATSNDEEIHKILSRFGKQEDIISKGLYRLDGRYKVKDEVYIEKNGVKYYFVAKVENPPAGPPNLNYWIPDQCSKTIYGCKLRWLPLTTQEKGTSFPARTLPFGGFPAANKAGV